MIGARLGQWIIEKELGRGGMGCVYLARRDGPGEGPARAAVKVLAAELAVDPGFLQRFRREIDILRQLDHPNIVRFLESGEQDGRYFFAMEYVPGPSFDKIREERRKLPWREVLDLAVQIAPALKHAHDRGIIHRDLKPSNLLRAEAGPPEAADGVVKLTDFGIASLFASPHLTVTGGVVGTAEYLSPEQAAGKAVTPRSDLYSLGVVLYTLVTGRPPFEGEMLDLLHKHRFAQPDRPSRLVPEIPSDFDEIICQLLEKDPGQRPTDGGVLFRRLDGLRRRLDRRAALADAPTEAPATVLPEGALARLGGEGPATLMARLMRRELKDEARGGPVKRFFNRPLVLVILFALTLGAIVWTFWPSNPETMFQRGAALMASDDPDQWEEAWDKYLGPLQAKHPDNPHQAEIAEFRRRIEAHQAGRAAERTARHAGPMTEAQWFYQDGLRRRQQGDEAGAQRVWRALVAAFKDVPSEAPWVRRAVKESNTPDPRGSPAEREWAPVREAIQHAQELRKQGKDKEADAILDALKDLYRNDPAAAAIFDKK